MKEESTEPIVKRYSYTHVPTLRRFALDQHRHKGIMGPFGSGKSSGCVQELVRRAHEQVPSSDGIKYTRWAVVRNTYKQLADSTIRTFFHWYPPKFFGEYNKTDHNYIITAFPGIHTEICFRALDREDQVANLLSVEYTGAWINEAREVPYSVFTALDGRIDRYPAIADGGATWAGIIMDTNPPTNRSWWYKLFEEKRPENAILFKQPSGRSPHAENLNQLKAGYYTTLAIGKDEMYVRVYIDGEYGYILEGKPVFPSFKDNVHVASHILTPTKMLPLIVGMDFGLSPSIVIGQVTARGQLLIFEELTSNDMGLKQFCKNQLLPLLQTKYFGFKIMGYGDPAGRTRVQTDESTCYDILHSEEVALPYIIEAPTNALVPRIGAVENYLNKMVDGMPAFVLSPNCGDLREALNGGYCYKKMPGADERYQPEPDKNNPLTHISDALQYLCLYAGGAQDTHTKEEDFRKQIERGPSVRTSGGIGGY